MSNERTRALAATNAVCAVLCIVLEIRRTGLIELNWALVLFFIVWFFVNGFIFFALWGRDEKK